MPTFAGQTSMSSISWAMTLFSEPPGCVRTIPLWTGTRTQSPCRVPAPAGGSPCTTTQPRLPLRRPSSLPFNATEPSAAAPKRLLPTCTPRATSPPPLPPSLLLPHGWPATHGRRITGSSASLPPGVPNDVSGLSSTGPHRSIARTIVTPTVPSLLQPAGRAAQAAARRHGRRPPPLCPLLPRC